MSPPHFRHRFRRCLGAWILAWLLALPALAGNARHGQARVKQLTLAGSFAADALLVRERKIPILVFYSRPGCRWCELARNNFLLPLANNPAVANRVLIREIDLDNEFDTPLTDFGGRTTTHSAFGRTRRIRLTPTIDFLDDHGMRLVEPIVGMRLADFYGTQIERGLEESLAKLRSEAR